MITVKDLREKAQADIAASAAYTVNAMINVAWLALENETSGPVDAERVGYVRNVLELAASLSELVIEGSEDLEREAKRGLHTEKTEAA